MREKRLKRKLYIIGIDAAPLWLLKEFQNENGFEPFKKFFKLNQISDLESTLPPLTGPSWPSIYTGLTPGEHGVPDFFVMKKDYVKDVAYYDSSDHLPFWTELAKRGHRCLVITPPMNVMLPEHKNIDMITGFPLKSRTDNAELQRLMKKYKFYGEPDIEKEMTSGGISDEKASVMYVQSVRSRSDIAKEMIETNDYGLVYVCFTETDRMQHFSLNKKNWKDYVLPIYREIAIFIDYIQERVDRENALLLIVSDHGAQPIYNKFLMNKWLIDNGYASLRETVFENIKNSNSKKVSISYRIREFLLRTKIRKAYDVMPHSVKSLVHRSIGKVLSGAGSGSHTRLHIFDFDMTKTKAFAEISNNPVATIWINDRRFVDGIVGERKKQKLINELIAKLKDVKSYEGDRMFEDVFESAPYYGNTDMFIQPDIFAEAKTGYTIDIFNFSLSEPFMRPEHAKSGDHTRNGIFGFYSHLYRIDMGNIAVADAAQVVLDYFNIKKNRRSRLMMTRK